MKCPFCKAPIRAVYKYCPCCKQVLPPVEAQDVEPAAPVAPLAGEQPPSAVSGFDALVQFGTGTWGGEPSWFRTSGRVAHVGAWRTDEGWRLLTFGNSFLEVSPWRYELSGSGFELTCEFDGDEVPDWLPTLLSRLSVEVEQVGIVEEPEELYDLLLSPEALPPLATDNGRVTLLRLSPAEADCFSASSRTLTPEDQLLALAQSLARPSVVLWRTADETSSCVGGEAPVGDAFVWPSVGGQPLPLLLNFDLSEVPGDPLLPTAGRLLVFGPPDSDTFERQGPTASYQVRYVEDGLGPRTAGHLLQVEGLAFKVLSALPPRHVLREAPELADLDEDVLDELLDSYEPEQPEHALLGWSHPYQGDVCFEAVSHLRAVRFPLADDLLAELRAEAAEWLQLLTLRSDAEWSFAGDGRLYLVIRRDDLAARRFERCRCVIQR